jgi:hypothetical protein
MDLDRLRARGARAFPNAAADFVMNCVRAIVASEKDMPPDREGLLAATALRKLQGTEEGEPTPAELAALELMIRMTRPAPCAWRHSRRLFEVRAREDLSRVGAVPKSRGTFCTDDWPH